MGEGQRQIELRSRLSQREQLLELRQDVLRLERDLLLARGDEMEIVADGRESLRPRLADRQAKIERRLTKVSADLLLWFPGVLDAAPLVEGIERYWQSVESELALADRIGSEEDGLLGDMRRLEKRLLDGLADGTLRRELLELQVLQREFVGTFRTSDALSLLTRVDALLDRRETLRRPEPWWDDLTRYRRSVEGVMSSSLELNLVRSQSGVRFDRLPDFFRTVERPLDRRLENNSQVIAKTRRQAGLMAAAFVALVMLGILLRMLHERARRRSIADRVRRLATGMQEFGRGLDTERLDLPREGDLGQVSTSFLAMARQIHEQIATIDAERLRAEDAAQAKSDFLAMVSHELRTPLNGILGMSELLEPALQDARQRHLLQVIQRSGTTLLSVVNDLLDFSKLEAGKLEMEARPFDLLEMLEDLIEIHAPAAHDKGLELVLQLPFEEASDGDEVDGKADGLTPRRLLGDPLRLGQVLTNLIGNAVKFTERGHVEVTLRRLVPLGEDRVRLELSVRDTGPGVPQHLQDHIFSAFAQGEAILRRKHGGSGLGLSIVQELLALMGGGIELVDDGQAGACFSVHAELGRGAGEEASPEALAPAVLEGKRVLLVDAHAPSLHATAQALRRLGAHVETSAGAEEALHRGWRAMDAVVLGHPAVSEDDDLPILTDRLVAQEIPVLHLLPSSKWSDGLELPANHLPRPPRRSRLLEALRGSLESGVVPSDAAPSALPQEVHGHVLLVEDNPVNQEVFQIMVANMGCQVSLAENGLEAVEAVRRHTFDLIFMDCYMPEMDGFEATEAIRRVDDPDRASVPVIALTASVFDSTRQRCLDCGMNDVLTKPVTQELLMACVRKWLRESVDQEEPAKEESAKEESARSLHVGPG